MNAKASVALCAAILCGFCAWRVTQVHDAHPTTEERAISLLRFMRSLNQDTKVSEEELEVI